MRSCDMASYGGFDLSGVVAKPLSHYGGWEHALTSKAQRTARKTGHTTGRSTS